jgi:hypothetical protein
MFEKAGKFYADWRDAEGRRHRKSFITALAARRHENKMKGNQNPPTGRATSRKSARP